MEEQGLIVVKDNFINKVANFFRTFLFRRKNKEIEELQTEENMELQEFKIELIQKNEAFVQNEILNARRAFRKYSINNTKNISNDILNLILNKIKENENKIEKIIEINKDQLSYLNIEDIIKEEIENLNMYKSIDKKTYGYFMPIGVVGVECTNAKESIKALIKAVSTRNSIIVLHKNYNQYSTESLILLIIQECLKNFYVDDNIVQICEDIEIDHSSLDRIISNDDSKQNPKNYSKEIFIYQEDDLYEQIVKEEYEKIKELDKFLGYNVRVIKGEFSSVVNFLTTNKPFAVCMFTNNDQKAYKFMNWIDSSNVFINVGIENDICIENPDLYNMKNNKYYELKKVVHKDIFD